MSAITGDSSVRSETRLNRWAHGFEAFCSRRPVFVLGAACLIYFACMLLQSAGKPLWYDELFVHLLAALPLSELWTALKQGAEVHPPLSFTAAHLFQLLLGPSAFASRLPSVLAFLLMSLAIFAMVRRKLGAAWAFSAVLFVFLTSAEFYATEARPYAILMGCAALSLLCWQRLILGEHRYLNLLGIFLSIAAAVSAHFLGVLIPFPIVLGELWRTRTRRGVDFLFWLAVAAGTGVIFVYLPIMHAAQRYVEHNLNAGRLGLATKLYTEPLKPLLVIAPLVVIALWAASADASGQAPRSRRKWTAFVPAEEWAAITGLMSLPLLLLALSRVTNSMNPRYTNSMVIGAALLFVYACATLFGRDARIGFVCFLALTVAAAMTGVLWFKNTYGISNRVPHSPPVIDAAGFPDLPIVVDQALQFLPIYYYNPALRSRLYFVASPEDSRRTTGSDTLDLNLLGLRPWVPIQVADRARFFHPGAHFLLFVSAADPIVLPNWEQAEVLAMGGTLQFVRRQNTGDYTFRADIP